MEAKDFAKQLLLRDLPPRYVPGAPPQSKNNAGLAALLHAWREEDATNDPEEIRQAEQELEEFKHDLNANRAVLGRDPSFYDNDRAGFRSRRASDQTGASTEVVEINYWLESCAIAGSR